KDDIGERLPSAIARVLYRPVRRSLLFSFDRKADRRPKKKRSLRYSRFGAELPTSELMDALVGLTRAERDVSGVQARVKYNYDDLLDEKLIEQHVKCKTVLSGKDRIPQGTLPCYHVHGLIPAREAATHGRTVTGKGNFVFSEDEYHAEYSEPYKWSNM